MQTIVVTGVTANDARPSAKQASSGPTNGSSHESVDDATRKTNRSSKSSERDEATPPFWTWFIENPRASAA